ncbi:hypothetical protein [Corallococcus interemptor]|uniref:hypothetical protein n=1 Tax=Corallococcus interemptor TaxID=2316720 RepID=UPI0011C3A6EA|nr:hypothetical protein [Corallococcus interemptor]
MRIRGEALKTIVRGVLGTASPTDSDQDICFRVFNDIRAQGNTVQFPDIIVALDDVRGNVSPTAMAHRRVTRLAEESTRMHAEAVAAERAPRLHYIWWGPVPESGLEGIQAMVTECGTTVSIQLWCKAEHATAFGGALPGVVIQGLDADMNHDTLPANPFPKLAEAVAWLTAKRAFSAVKDVLMLYLLYQAGGHYLDTTTAPMGGMQRMKYKARRFKDACKITPMDEFTTATLGIKFARIGQGREFYPGARPWIKDTDTSTHPVMTPSVDFWAAWARKGNAIARASLEAYLDFITEMKAKAPEALASERRDQIIGDLITLSVQMGMLKDVLSGSRREQEVYELLQREMWSFGALDQQDYESLKANFILPEIGVMKWHKGSWRNKH